MTEELNNQEQTTDVEQIHELLDSQKKIVEELLDSQKKIVEELLDSQDQDQKQEQIKKENLNVESNEIEQIIRSSIDSENLVRNLVSVGEHSEDIHNTIKRNIDHLSIILSKEEIQASNSPRLVGFQEAVDLGVAFISE